MPASAAGLERVLTWAGEPLNTEADGLMNRRGKLDTVVVNGPEDVTLDWDAIDWRFHEQNVIRLRRRIFKATREQDWAKVRSLQKLMLGSWSKTLMSVRQVTQRNGGDRRRGCLVVVRASGCGGACAPQSRELESDAGPARVHSEGQWQAASARDSDGGGIVPRRPVMIWVSLSSLIRSTR
jgi:hypothetical protein